MAFKGGAAPVKPGMQDRIASNIARDGAAKRPQTKFETKWTHRSRIGEVDGVGGKGPDGAPDASNPSPLDPTAPGKKFAPAPTKWGMKGEVDHELGSKVLIEGSSLTGRG